MNEIRQLGDAIHLARADDLPVHQFAQPVSVPASSDTHFNDGYYFGAFTPEVHAFLGLRVHPNSNVIDGFAGVVHDGHQFNTRASRALIPETDVLAVGPIQLDIDEPMVQHRVRLSENELNVTFDLVFRASSVPIVEHSHRQYRFSRLHNDVRRYTQCARADGMISVGGVRLELDAAFACRDHSWGIRAAMGPAAPIGGHATPQDRDPRAMRVWLPVELGDLQGFLQFHEDASGRTLDLEGTISDGSSVRHIRDVRHQLEYHPGTRRFRGGELHLVLDDSSVERWTLEPTGSPAHPQGFGYRRGWSDGNQPGVFRGLEHLEHDVYEVGRPDAEGGPDHLPRSEWLGAMEYVCRISDDHGRSGLVQFEHAVYRDEWIGRRQPDTP